MFLKHFLVWCQTEYPSFDQFLNPGNQSLLRTAKFKAVIGPLDAKLVKRWILCLTSNQKNTLVWRLLAPFDLYMKYEEWSLCLSFVIWLGWQIVQIQKACCFESIFLLALKTVYPSFLQFLNPLDQLQIWTGQIWAVIGPLDSKNVKKSAVSHANRKHLINCKNQLGVWKFD